jgi:hypothetical protein
VNDDEVQKQIHADKKSDGKAVPVKLRYETKECLIANMDGRTMEQKQKSDTNS